MTLFRALIAAACLLSLPLRASIPLAIRRGCCSFERELRRLTGYDFISADAREVHILLRVALHKAERLASPWFRAIQLEKEPKP